MTLPITEPPIRPRTPRWPYALAAGFLALGLVVLLFWPIKLPYFAMSPGPVESVTDLVTVADVVTYESDGEFYLLTVGLREVNAFEYVEAQFDNRIDLVAREAIRPSGVSQEEVTRTNLAAMDESIDTAVFVALARLGYDVGFVGEGVEVLEVVEGAPADGAIEVGDRFTVVAGVEVATAEEAAEIIRSYGIGDTITLEGTRIAHSADEPPASVDAREPVAVEITLGAHPDIEGAPMVGVLFDTVNLGMDLPVDVDVDSRNIGGPSAGMTYALALIDLLTPEDLTKGHVIAGTGTIRFDETVGAIGGVRQKVFAARAIGAEIVFVPTANYDTALTAAGDGIEIVPVNTLQDALDHLAGLEPASLVAAAG
jgi:PDZ domain-containing protein